MHDFSQHRQLSWLAVIVYGAAANGCAVEGGDATAPVEQLIRPVSYMDMKYGITVRQQLDFSCGAAALASLATFYWGERLSEVDVLKILLSRYSTEERKKKKDEGFSFDDLIFAAKQLGFEAEGARIDSEELSKAAGPLIVHLDKGTFQHFSVLRRASKGTYYLSDPVVGTITMPKGEFVGQYTGFALALWRKGSTLPDQSRLTDVRDGTNVSLSLGRTLNPPAYVFAPIH